MTATADGPREAAIEALLELLASDPEAPSSVTDPDRARDVHVADSRTALCVERLSDAARIADLGAGAGFPGLVLALELPAADVDLIESSQRKCRFLDRAITAVGAENARVVCDRAEAWAVEGSAGREAYEAVTARAIGRLATIAELASPLLRDGGVLVCWKGSRDRDEETELARAADSLALEPREVIPVRPYPRSRDRHLHVIIKRGPTPERLPRRPGRAAKRPPGS